MEVNSPYPQQAAGLAQYANIDWDNRLVYLAGPFFKPEQREVIEWIEHLLEHMDIKYFSPREYGVITGEARMNSARIQRIFDMNIRMLRDATDVVAVTDDFDPGTMFEIGFFYSMPGLGRKSNIITYSAKGYGANVMIARATFTHCTSMEELEQALNGHPIEELEVTE